METNMNRKQKIAFLGVIALYSLFIGLLLFQRRYFGFGTETDYLGGFLPEAQRIIEGQPLLLEFHPPLYSMLLSLVQTVTQDWLRTGLLVSFVTGLIALVTNFLFFYRLLDIYAGWGALLGLMTSTVFLEYSVYATSDIFSLALYSSSLLLSLLAVQKKSAYLWILCGMAVGCLLLTRTNGITCLFIAVLPLWSNATFKQKINNFLFFAAGLSIPLLFWFTYALLSGSRFTPAGTYANFALTYFSPKDRVSGDARMRVEEQFDSLISVLSYDPVHIAKVYLKDLVSLGKEMARMLQPWLVLFIPVGVFSFFRNSPENRKICTFYIVLTLLQVLLINFKAYEARYFLFFIPILGIFVGEAFRYLTSLAPRPIPQRVVIGFCTVCAVFALTLSYSTSWEAVSSSVGELPEMVARKLHLPFYTGSTSLPFPDVETLPELRCALETQSGSGDLFLYYGTQEKAFRRQFKALSNPQSSPTWLSPVEQSAEPNQWVLYQYSPDAQAIASQPCTS